MKRTILILFLAFHIYTLLAINKYPENPYQSNFEKAYQLYPNIPRGFLEAFAWHNTRIQKLDPNLHSCTGKPMNIGVLGLIYDGQNYFFENGTQSAFFSGYSIKEMMLNPETEILAFAAFFNSTITGNMHVYDKLKKLAAISEIPADNSIINAFAREAMLWEWIKFLNDPYAAQNYGFEKYGIDEKDFFGDNYKIHSASELILSETYIKNTEGDSFAIPKSADYAPALWVAAPTCNYGSRNGTAVSAVTIHTVQGSYAGCISWFGNCNAGVSAHYVLRSSDGQVTQMVLESARAYHVGSENPYTIGLEHEGYVNNAAWYTTAMYQSSANLVKDIVASGYGINALRTSWFPWAPTTHYNASSIPGSCVRIKGHQHYPNQTHTDPGANWDWDYYFKLIHPTPTATVLTATSGTITDSGGSGNYSNDERSIWTISPPNALSITLNFTSFNVENNWDYLYVYNGNNIFAPLLGVYTGSNIPSTLVANSGSITLEFRSDCATTGPGWEASWTTQMPGPVTPPDLIPPITSIQNITNWIISDTLLYFTDSDSGSGLKNTYYNILYSQGNSWKGLLNKGFLFDNFETIPLSSDWTNYTGVWSSTGQNLIQSDESENNTNIGIALNQNQNNAFLYHFSAAYSGASSNRRFGFHFMCDSVQKTNRGNSYFVWYRDMYQDLEIYKVTNDVFTMVYDTNLVLSPAQFYDFKVAFDKVSGEIEVWVNNQIVARYTDPNPLQIGNAVSFRTGNALLQVSQIETYVGRTANTSLVLEVGPNSELPHENISPSNPAGLAKSIISDQVGNLGQAQLLLNVDFSEPIAPQNLSDMNLVDEDLIIGNPSNTYSAFWDQAIDVNSGIAEYFVVLNNPQSNSFVSVGSVLNYDFSGTFILDETYKFGIYAVNNAGLKSDTVYSDGFKWSLPNSLYEDKISLFKIYPNPSNGIISIKSDNYPIKIWVFDLMGRLVYQNEVKNGEQIDLGEKLANSQYLILLEREGNKEVQKLILKK